MNNNYYFVTRWRIQGRAEEVFDLISNPLDYPRWWPAVYLDVEQVGQCRYQLLTRGWLPYILRWQSETVDSNPPRRLEIRATGDFDGRGIWTLEQVGNSVDVTFDWRLTAEKPLLRTLSPLLKPAFEENHRWAMEQGRISLELELLRHHARSRAELERVPPPPGPSRTSAIWLAAGAAAIAGTLLLALHASRSHET
jgi:hypothetical protein